MKKANCMKPILTATAAAALALAVQAQTSGPSHPGPGALPGTFQLPGATSSSIQVTTPDSAAIKVAPPITNPDLSPVPHTPIGTPDARGGTITDQLRTQSSFPSSRDWETGSAERALNQSGEGRRLTPLPDAAPTLPAIQGASNTKIQGTAPAMQSRSALDGSGVSGTGTTPAPAMRSDLNTTGVNTPARVPEKPLDKALTAKIRAQLTEAPQSTAARLTPETIRDLRITSQGGKVILEGNVASSAQKQLAEMEARRVPGVIAVENHLNVRDTSVGAPAAGQTGQGQSSASPSKGEHPEISPDF
jgi:hypothetical protein